MIVRDLDPAGPLTAPFACLHSTSTDMAAFPPPAEVLLLVLTGTTRAIADCTVKSLKDVEVYRQMVWRCHASGHDLGVHRVLSHNDKV